jgi:hypothetical protein
MQSLCAGGSRGLGLIWDLVMLKAQSNPLSIGILRMGTMPAAAHTPVESNQRLDYP